MHHKKWPIVSGPVSTRLCGTICAIKTIKEKKIFLGTYMKPLGLHKAKTKVSSLEITRTAHSQ